jgi:3-phenylpropionate/trans-cinnamate dioxygenase ferredoxin reductase subunit
VHLLRTTADADELAAAAATAQHIVVIGSGWIGCEAAASLRQLGKDVTVIAPEPVPLQRVLGDEIGSVFARLHTDHGVQLRLATGVAEIRGETGAERVVTDRGEEIACDLVVGGVGAIPRDELAVKAGLHCENGVFVDARFRTNGSNVYAAGDVAAVDHPRYGRLRVEHWASAKDHGAAAARSMLGSREPYDRLPFFWSDQFEIGMEYTGRATPGAELVIRGDVQAREFIAFWHRAGRLEAGMNVNVWDVSDEIDRLIRSDAPVDLGALADPEVPLAELAPVERVA